MYTQIIFVHIRQSGCTLYLTDDYGADRWPRMICILTTVTSLEEQTLSSYTERASISFQNWTNTPHTDPHRTVFISIQDKYFRIDL